VAGEDCSLRRDLIEEGGDVAGKAIPVILPVWVVWQMAAAMAAQVKGRDRTTNGAGYRL
jgi:phosphotransferase system  glucose/maltose/N-acetylglucosamine-specific IIC component